MSAGPSEQRDASKGIPHGLWRRGSELRWWRRIFLLITLFLILMFGFLGVLILHHWKDEVLYFINRLLNWAQ
jgi:hypothetical protein